MASSVMEGSGVKANVDNETLMDCVQNYRCIYDKTCKHYKNSLSSNLSSWKSV